MCGLGWAGLGQSSSKCSWPNPFGDGAQGADTKDEICRNDRGEAAGGVLPFAYCQYAIAYCQQECKNKKCATGGRKQDLITELVCREDKRAVAPAVDPKQTTEVWVLWDWHWDWEFIFEFVLTAASNPQAVNKLVDDFVNVDDEQDEQSAFEKDPFEKSPEQLYSPAGSMCTHCPFSARIKIKLVGGSFW